MGIETITMYSGVKNKAGNALSDLPLSGVGSKGQEMQTKITKVGGDVSVQLNGKETTASGYSLADCTETEADLTQTKEEATESLSVLSGEDYAGIEEKEGSLADTTKECVARAVEKIKEKREWKEARMEEASQLREELQEGLEKQQAAGFLTQKSEEQLRSVLQEAGIPVTEDILAKVVTALGMSQSALDITDQTKSYMVERGLEPTIENLYQGRYSAAVSGKTEGNAQDFAEYQKQIEQILADCGKADENGMEQAKWLFANELPINEETLGQLDVLDTIAENMTIDKVLEQIVFAMTEGFSPKDASLDDSAFTTAREVIQDVQNMDDLTILHAADLVSEAENEPQQEEENPQSDGKGTQKNVINLALLRQAQAAAKQDAETEKTVIPTVYAEDMTEADILKVTMKRQLEEIRQKMTLQSAVAMERRGIHIETESLDKVIASLREMENAYYRSQAAAGSEEIESSHLDLLQETLGKTADIAASPASLLGTSVRQQALLTVNELHAAVTSQTASRNDWQNVFERVSTQARADMGDSIQKAFAGIPDLLKRMGLEDTQANERAVRILGYNEMELSEENIEQVKQFDAKVNRVIDNMKPTVVLELIRRGQNPLDTPLDELNQKLEEIQDEKGISSEERYSRFLWQMEKSGQITEEERTGYIGVYRLLNQLQKTDGAVIGAVMESQQELTLGNLLTQARTRRGNGINAVVDEKTGMNEGRQIGNSITDQIQAGFSGGSPVEGQNTGNPEERGQQQKQYYQHLAKEALEELTPSKLQEMTEGEVEKLSGLSLERFHELLQQTAGDETAQKEYFEEQAKLLRETLASSEKAEKYLENLQIPLTVENLMAASAVLEGTFAPYQESDRRKNVLTKEQQEEWEELVDSIEESVGEEEDLSGKCEKAEKIMGEILTKSYEKADISFEDLSTLRKLGQEIRFEGNLRHSQSYDIPIRTGDTVTSLNLTLVHGSEESGKIQISMEDETFGHISMDVRVQGSQIKGLVLCDERQGFEALQSEKETLQSNLEYAGYQIKNISYGMDFKERNELSAEQAEKQQADMTQLYQIAKVLVRHVAAIVKAE